MVPERMQKMLSTAHGDAARQGLDRVQGRDDHREPTDGVMLTRFDEGTVKDTVVQDAYG
jgi:hypothetical protein